jgi:hypothetical protein
MLVDINMPKMNGFEDKTPWLRQSMARPIILGYFTYYITVLTEIYDCNISRLPNILM